MSLFLSTTGTVTGKQHEADNMWEVAPWEDSAVSEQMQLERWELELQWRDEGLTGSERARRWMVQLGMVSPHDSAAAGHNDAGGSGSGSGRAGATDESRPVHTEVIHGSSTSTAQPHHSASHAEPPHVDLHELLAQQALQQGRLQEELDESQRSQATAETSTQAPQAETEVGRLAQLAAQQEQDAYAAQVQREAQARERAMEQQRRREELALQMHRDMNSPPGHSTQQDQASTGLPSTTSTAHDLPGVVGAGIDGQGSPSLSGTESASSNAGPFDNITQALQDFVPDALHPHIPVKLLRSQCCFVGCHVSYR